MPIRFSPQSQEVMRRAQREAVASSLLWPRAEHLLLALLDDPSVADAFAALGADPARVAQQARDYLASPPAVAAVPAPDDWGRRLWRWLFPPVPRDVALVQRRAVMQVLASGRADITPLDLLVALFRASDQRLPVARAGRPGASPYRAAVESVAHPMTALRHDGVTTAALLRYVSHGEAAPARAPRPVEPDTLVEVHLLNDDYTPLEFVVATLREQLGLGAAEAAEVADCAHREGVCLVGTWRFGDVGGPLRRIEERAARVGYPLKLVVTELAASA